MKKDESLSDLKNQISILETRIKHLTNDLYLTKEEYANSTKNYLEIYDKMDNIIRNRTQKLRISKEKFQSIFENIQSVYFETSLDDKILEISPSVETFTLYRPQDLIGKPVSDLYFDPLDRQTFLETLLKDGSLNEYEIKMKDKNGVYKTCLLNSKLIKDTSGNPEKIVGSLINIQIRVDTEEALRRSEEKLRISEGELRSILNNAPDIIFRLDPAGNITYINRTLKEYGFSPSEVIGKKLLGLIHPDDRKKATHRVKERRTGARCQGSLEIRFLTKDQHSIPFESKGRSFGSFLIESEGIYCSQKPSQDNFVGTIVIARDISERKQMEAELQQAQKIEAIGIMAGGLAHDYNNLLSVIMGNISMAEKTLRPESEHYNYMMKAKQASLQARELTKKLNTFSKGGKPIKEPGSIRELIKKASVFLKKNPKVTLKQSIAPNLWPVDFDRGQMKQALTNILANAEEAMPNGGSIRVGAENYQTTAGKKGGLSLPEGKYIKISIRDQGIGIPEKNLSKIFDIYFSTKKMGAKKGLGLGLTTTHSIITRHKGLITAESIVETGTTITLYLPIYEKHREQKSQPGSLEELPAVSTGKILVMDDEEMIRELTRQMLTHLDYQVVVAEDGKKAVELYREAIHIKAPFEIVILDLIVDHGMGGKDALIELLKIDPGVKAIVSSGYSEDPIMSNYREHGFRDVLPKPYQIKDMSRVLKKISSKKK